MRFFLLAVLVPAPMACSDDDECNGFGCPTDSASAADDGATTAATDPTVDPTTDPSTADDDGTTAADDGPMTSPESSSADPSASDTTSAPESTSNADDGSTTAPPCEGADCPMLGECFGIGIWESCAQFCDANDATCVENGCDGATVVYYGDAMACIAMRSNGEASQACDAAFDEQGGGVSFGRCCCDA